MKRFLKIVFNSFVFNVLCWAAITQAQDGHSTGYPEPATTDVAAPILTAQRLETPPVLDGDVLGDSVWQRLPAADRFWQTRPDEGQPASQRTEVRVAYTADRLYFGVVCYDTEPERIIISDSRRDASLDDSDSFQIILDTYLDRQNGFVFGTNPAGIEYDGQVTNEGRGSGRRRGRAQRGSGGGFNLNWDASWEVRTKIGDFGWSAEFAIPFRTLRYRQAVTQTWGINYQRNIRRRKESAYWAPLPRQYNLYRVSQAGQLSGLEIPSQRNLKLVPYVLGGADQFTPGQENVEWQKNFGLDAKFGVTPNLNLDLTYNTDFAQVEADQQQINLNRFNLFFPEKRPFFLENAGTFSVGNSGEVELFFSRRIGIGAGGIRIPILLGGRLSGKVSKYNIGFLDMQTESVGDSIAANNFAVARVYRDLPNRSGVGVIFVQRLGTGAWARDNDYNHTLGLDGKIGIGEFGQVSGFVAGTNTPGVRGKEYAFQVGGSYNSAAWLTFGNFMQVSNDFNPEVGFLRRRGFRKVNGIVMYRYRPKYLFGLQELRPHASYRGYWNFAGIQETGFFHVDNHFEWKSSYEVHTGVNFTREGVVWPFEIYPGVEVPAGMYDNVEAQIVGITNQGAPMSLRVTAFIGGFFGGNRMTLSSQMRMRLRETLTSEILWDRNDIHLPEGSFVINLVSARLSYAFTPKIALQALIQYNDRDNLWSTNLRFSWLQTASTGLYLVYNETQDIFDRTLTLRNRNVILKYSYLFDVIR